MHYTYIFLLTTIVISGCSSINNLAEGDKINYRNGLSATSPLEIPPQINKSEINPQYVAPDSQTFIKFVEQRANNSQVLTSIPEARIERDGQRRWLVVNKTPDEIWPKIEKFWQDLGFKLEVNSPQTGIIETNWLENKAGAPKDALRELLSSIIEFAFSSEKKDRFRTRVERHNNETEIYVTHQGIEEQFSDKSKDSTKYYRREAQPEIEAEILRKMMISFGLNEQQAKYLSSEYQKNPAENKLDNKNTTNKSATSKLDIQELLVSSTPDNAWRSVGIALDRANFTIEERNIEKLNYKVRYLDPNQFNQQPGFWGRLTKGQKIEEMRKSKIYTIQIQNYNNQAKVIILDVNNQVSTTDSAKSILTVIKENL